MQKNDLILNNIHITIIQNNVINFNTFIIETKISNFINSEIPEITLYKK